MRKIDLTNYDIKTKVPNSDPMGLPLDAVMPYHVVDSIVNVMFIRELQLQGAELIKQEMLAMKLENCKEDSIILEDTEYERIKKAFDTYKGFTRPDVELVRRILEAEEVEVETKK